MSGVWIERIPGWEFNKWRRYARYKIRLGWDFEMFDKWARVEAFMDGTRLEWIAPLSNWARKKWSVWEELESESLFGSP